jgi:protein SCO1/2
MAQGILAVGYSSDRTTIDSLAPMSAAQMSRLSDHPLREWLIMKTTVTENQEPRTEEQAAPASADRAKLEQPERVGPITRILWAVLVLTMAGIIALKIFEPHRRELPVLYHAASFSLIDQNGRPFRDADLRDNTYICDFVFTTCGSVCPMMSAHLRDLQKNTPAKVQLVSFTVDPEHDTPAVLKEYAGRYQADERRWHFLTGTTAQMYQVARKMRLVVMPPTATEGLLHDEHFMLIDGDGNVRGVYDSKDSHALDQLRADATYLAKSRRARG